MSWSIGFDDHWDRYIGYGVPAYCDHPECHEQIDRGLAYVCGGEPYGGAKGCGLYFCGAHLIGIHPWCARCARHESPFEKKPEHPQWVEHVSTDESWAEWRALYPEKLAAWQLP